MNEEKDLENIIKDANKIVKDASKEAKEFVEDLSDTIKSKKNKKDVEKDTESFEDKYLKSLAEMENFRKRMEEERIDLYKFSSSSLIQEILPTLDMFEMALNSKNVSNEIKNWLVGFKMILKNFKMALESQGVKEIITKPGDKFNSDFHHALGEEESNEFKEGRIIKAKSKGYLLHDRLLRPAAVIVVKKKEEIKEEIKIDKKKGENHE